ncbi:MAG: SRPBCC family protein, partial [Bacteroidota bacterium]
MPLIYLETYIKADINIVFDLSRSVDLHKISTAHTDEEAIAGVTSGLMSLNDTVTWRARHFGLFHQLSSQITDLTRPSFFADEQIKGAFKSFRHEHHFKQKDDKVLMIDYFDYKSPLWVLGNLADWLFLEKYMTGLLLKRNATIKEFAESNRWKELL